MELIHFLVDFILHIDQHLDQIIGQFGPWTYAILIVIIFCETGLVVTPFLPGDSLLFAAGALAGRDLLNPHLLAIFLIVAAIIGDAVNYTIGHFIGPRALEMNSRLIKREYLEKTQRFYDKYGGKTIIIARFVPIVRTFAPFLAGVGKMSYPQFAMYNVIGAILWVLSFIYAGYFFGEMPFVKNNFTMVIFAIIIISIMPGVIEIIRAKYKANAQP